MKIITVVNIQDINMFLNKNILNIQQNYVRYDYDDLQYLYENDKLNNKTYIYHLAGRDCDTRYEKSKKYFDNIFSISKDKCIK
jgi:hypothetical protein